MIIEEQDIEVEPNPNGCRSFPVVYVSSLISFLNFFVFLENFFNFPKIIYIPSKLWLLGQGCGVEVTFECVQC